MRKNRTLYLVTAIGEYETSLADLILEDDRDDEPMDAWTAWAMSLPEAQA